MGKTLTTFAELLRPYYTTSGPPAPPEPWLVELRRQQSLPLAERSTDYLLERIRDARKSYYSWCEREEAEETAAELARRGNPIGEGDLPRGLQQGCRQGGWCINDRRHQHHEAPRPPAAPSPLNPPRRSPGSGT